MRNQSKAIVLCACCMFLAAGTSIAQPGASPGAGTPGREGMPMGGMHGGQGRGMMHGQGEGDCAGMQGGHMMGGGMGGGGMNNARGGHTMPQLPPGNEKLQLQMHAEMMQKMGEILAKYAGQVKE